MTEHTEKNGYKFGEQDKAKDNESENANFNSKKDPAGTDPDRYKYISSGINEKADDEHEEDYDKPPKNHTTPEERMLNPDRGEKKNK